MCLETFNYATPQPERVELNPIGKELVAALRSGEYTQAKGALRKVEGCGWGYCCLGVLCDLAAKKGLGKWKGDTGESIFIPNGGFGDRAVLPKSIVQWSGAKSAMGSSDNKPGSALTQLNDSGKTFTEIADAIETGDYGFTQAV